MTYADIAQLVFTLLNISLTFVEVLTKKGQIVSDPENAKYDVPDGEIINTRKMYTWLIENGLLWYIISAFPFIK